MINGIKTAHEAKVVAAELERIATNGTMIVLMLGMDPDLRPQVALMSQFLKGLMTFAEDLKTATHGLKDDDEVFATTEMDMKVIEGLGAVEDLLGGLPK